MLLARKVEGDAACASKHESAVVPLIYVFVLCWTVTVCRLVFFLFQVTVQNQRKHPLLLSSSPAAHGACLHLCVCVCVIKLAYRYNNVTDHIDLVIRIFLL